MKIVHIRDKYLGVTFIYFLLKGFRRHIHYIMCREIDIADLTKFPYDKIIRTSYIFFPLWFIDKFLTVKLKFNHRLINDWISYYYRIKQLKNVDLIHAHMGLQGVYALPLMRKLRCSLVTTFYGADMSLFAKEKYWFVNYQKLFIESDGIIVEGPFMKERMIDLGCPGEKIFISKIGISLEHMKFQFRPSFRSGESLHILMCANFTHKKGFFDALAVFRMLKIKGVIFKVSIIGDGILKKKIEDMIYEFDLSDDIILLGRRNLEEIYHLSQDCHVFFHPSKFGPNGDSEGGAPTIILEMQALGLPVVATRHADIPNIIPEQNHHLLAEEGNINELFSVFNNYLDNSRRWNEFSNAGRSFVEVNHSNVNCAKKLEDFYEKVYKSGNPF